jgi:hypothetical protein
MSVVVDILSFQILEAIRACPFDEGANREYVAGAGVPEVLKDLGAWNVRHLDAALFLALTYVRIECHQLAHDQRVYSRLWRWCLQGSFPKPILVTNSS